jgi:uncharacterized membrane protein YciS (DUF1049 family)
MSRRFQFSLRALLAVMFAAALLAGTFLAGMRFERLQRERETEAQHQAAHGDFWPPP